MSTPSAGQTDGSFFSNLLNRVRCAIYRWREVSRLDREEIDVVARDLNISPGELVALMYTSPDSLEQLDKRLAYAGLSDKALAASHPDELRDLRRVCSQCSSKARCARDIRHERMATPSKYCPNELTLRLLAREALKERMTQVVSPPFLHS
jgi:hypothetical protein